MPEVFYISRTASSFKLTYCRIPNEAGRSLPERDPDKGKRFDNVRRARTSFLDIGQCNHWEYMATFTSGCSDPSRDIRATPKWFNNWNSHHSASIRYLMVFERGEIGNRLHSHILLDNVPDNFVQPYSPSQYARLPYNLKRLYSLYKTDTGTRLAFCPWWRFGWSTLVPVDSSPKVVSYMTKYMTKQNIEFTTSFGGHSYFCSKGLLRPEKRKIPADIVGAMYSRVPAGSWSTSFKDENGNNLTSCTILDRDKIGPILWEYYSNIYDSLQ
nr:unnamed protein product [uncultured bacterium]